MWVVCIYHALGGLLDRSSSSFYFSEEKWQMEIHVMQAIMRGNHYNKYSYYLY